ncbi:MAG: HAMP domain-containing histidine kinase [Chloroflexi bacterium]|nr:HAMP domain-containing histidine kinase [Chloroflexota bacterium]MBV9601794.1 HAMP domain-containing histidine kinase [Chloroflexota bacterium]
MARNLQRRRSIDVQRVVGAQETEEFMSIAAHDLRNPIAVMRASAQMAQRQILRGDSNGAHTRLKSIVEQTDRLTDMLDSFLDAARLGTGKVALRMERVELRTVAELAVERTVALVRDQIERPVELDIPDGCIGNWDHARIARALRALVSNAFIYGDAAQPVRLWAHLEGARVHLVVSGGGPGPDAEEVDHLFERFYRGRSAAEAGQSGSGLGLFTARGIARLHGGDVRRIEGDRFEIELPVIG